jgi:hypothetical protein
VKRGGEERRKREEEKRGGKERRKREEEKRGGKERRKREEEKRRREDRRKRRRGEGKERGRRGTMKNRRPPSSQKICQTGYSQSRLIKKSGTCPRSSKAVFVNTV